MLDQKKNMLCGNKWQIEPSQVGFVFPHNWITGEGKSIWSMHISIINISQVSIEI